MTDDTDTPVVCAVVPARGGSKGVPGKNLRTVGGQSLVARAVHSLAAAETIDLVVVSTDDVDIAAAAEQAGAEVVKRPDHLAGDEASSESAVLHALDELAGRGVRPDVVVFAQATSPFIAPADVDRAVTLVRDGAHDVAFSAAPADVHLWRSGPDGPVGVNHDASRRLRRQDREAEWAETGAFYVMDASGFREHRHRFFGRTTIAEVPATDALDIDTVHDLAIADAMAARRQPIDQPIRAKAVVTDFDGVHTPDTVVVDQDGIEAVQVSRSDGMGVARLRRAGIPFLILSTEQNPVVQARARKLQVDCISGCDDKLTALRAWAQEQTVDLADITYLGNDVNDVDCLQAVGWPVTVADAHHDAHAASHLVLRRRGGDGAVRELADRVLAVSDRSTPERSTTEGERR